MLLIAAYACGTGAEGWFGVDCRAGTQKNGQIDGISSALIKLNKSIKLQFISYLDPIHAARTPDL
jgi:hypothetical protein